MYDQDILDEESILEWGESKPSKKYISKELSAEMKATSKKLIEWLKTADSESEEESSDDDIEMTDKKVIDPVFILFLSFP
jgi:translation initiation factor 5